MLFIVPGKVPLYLEGDNPDIAKAPPTSASRFQPTRNGSFARPARRRSRRRLGLERMVIVQPSVYGKDNSCTLDMTALVARRARPANRGGFEENVDGKVRCSAAIMVRRIRVNFGRLHHQIMVG
jgi:hypothetical protein